MGRNVARTACLVLLLCECGCGKGRGLNEEKQVTIESLGNWSCALPRQARDQQVKISVNSPATPVTVYLIAERDMDALMDQLANEKELKVAILEKKEKVRTVDFSKKMTVGNELAVVISNTTGQAANVTVKIAGE